MAGLSKTYSPLLKITQTFWLLPMYLLSWISAVAGSLGCGQAPLKRQKSWVVLRSNGHMWVCIGSIRWFSCRQPAGRVFTERFRVLNLGAEIIGRRELRNEWGTEVKSLGQPQKVRAGGERCARCWEGGKESELERQVWLTYKMCLSHTASWF